MINIDHVIKEIIQELLIEGNPDVGPCFFPGKFKPPHKGHFEAAKYLASKNYINRVYVVISNLEKFGITADDSLYIWREYLNAEPNPKIKVIASQKESPILDIFEFLKDNPEVSPVYVAANKDEIEADRFESLKKDFPDRVRIETIPDQYDNMSATDMRSAVDIGDYKDVAKFVPDSAYNKGVAKDVFARLIKGKK